MEIHVASNEVDGKWIGVIEYSLDVAKWWKAAGIRKYHNYIYSTFASFVKHKTKIIFDMRELSNCKKDFKNMIIGKSIQTIDEQDVATIKSMVNDGDKANLPKKEILTIFDNVKEFISSDKCLYILSLSPLLPILW